MCRSGGVVSRVRRICLRSRRRQSCGVCRSWLVEQSIEPIGGKAPSPFTHSVGVRPDLDADYLVLQPSRSGQDDTRSTRHRLAGLLRPGQRLNSCRSATLNSIATAGLPITIIHSKAHDHINFAIRTLA